MPPGYEARAVPSENGVFVCPQPNGTFNLYDLRTGSVVLLGVDEACVQQFGRVVRAGQDDPRCPETGACSLPTDKKFIVCPPSNGISLDYYLEADTAAYIQGMTTQSPACKSQPNVIQVAANSPYCGGSQVEGPGSGPPTLVACFKSHGNTREENIVDVHSGPDFALVAPDIMIKDIATRFPGQRYIVTSGGFCSALPDFGVSAPPPTPTPAPTPTPKPAPSPEPIPAPVTQQPPVSEGAIPTQPMPTAQPLARQVPLRAPGAAPAPPTCPPKAGDWWNRCLTKEAAFPVFTKEPVATPLETALGVGSVAAAALIAAFALK